MAITTQVYRYGGALFVIDTLISPESSAIKTLDMNGVVYWAHPERWAELLAELPHAPVLPPAPPTLALLAHDRLLALYHRVGNRPIVADDFATEVAERVNRAQ